MWFSGTFCNLSVIEHMFLFGNEGVFDEKAGVFPEKIVKKLLQFRYKGFILVLRGGVKWREIPLNNIKVGESEQR